MKNKLRILMINRWVGYNDGGNETHMKDLLYQFSSAGHSVSVITTFGRSLDFLPNVRCHYIKSPRGYFSYGFFGSFHALLFNIKSIFKFLELYIKGNRYDVVSVHFALEELVARFIKLFFGIPYVFVLAGDTPLELVCAKRADGKVQISEFMNKQCIKYGYRAEVIPKGIDLVRYNPNISGEELKKSLNLENKKVILTVCRLDPRKNVSFLLEAMANIVKTYSRTDIVLVIVGDGVEKPFLLQKVIDLGLQDYVKFIGNIPNTSPDHPKYYAMSDVFVLPTLYEGFGWVFLEAMACGVPIITTNVGSNPEVVGDVGILVEPNDVNDLTKNIINVLDDTELADSLKQRGLKKVSNFSWSDIFPKYEQLYGNVAKLRCKFVCRFKVFLTFFTDFLKIIWVVLMDKIIFNKTTDAWSNVGQIGSQKINNNIYVVFNSQVSADSMGGGDKIVLNNCKQLIQKNIHVVSFLGCPEGRTMMEASLSNVPFYYLNKLSVKNTWFVLTYVQRIFLSFNIFRAPIIKSSILYSASDFLPDTLPCFLYKLKNIKSKWIANLFLRARNPFNKEIELNISTILYFISQQISIFLFKSLADKVFVLCELDKQYLISQGLPEYKVTIIFGGVDTSQVDSVLDTPIKQYDACYIGRFHYQKGIDDLIYVWQKVTSHFSEAKLAIIGWGNDLAILKSLKCQKNIEILGFVDGIEKYKVIKASKILLFPSSFESWGVTLAEAICCHTPAVAYDLEVLTTNFLKGVIWVPKFDKDIYYNKVMELLKNDSSRHQLVSDAASFAKTLDWSVTSQLFINALNDL